MKTMFFIALTLAMPATLLAHEGHSHAPSPETQKKIVRLNTEQPERHLVVQRPSEDTKQPPLASLFDRFSDKVEVRFDRDFLFVESNGLPEHPMMIGITAWQQQVPLPQPYRGDNAWRIPLNPIPAKKPMSAASHFFRGAIALAVNGVPIFNPIKNDGKTDTLLAGELDQWGGHCGRADDYHYHIAPTHLEKIVGAGNPVAVALDGYPIYGYNDPNGKPPTNLDGLNGHRGPDGKYHYHATKTYPYLNGGFYGEVVERGGQVDPQPRAQGVRPAARPLRGAKITGFENPTPGRYIVRYEVLGDKRSVDYTVAENGSAKFSFVSGQGTTSETYTPRQRGGGGRGNAEPPPVQDRRPRRDRTISERGGRREGGGDPITRTLDSNGDGRIDEAELKQASSSLRALDKNKDGQITGDELVGPGGAERGPGGAEREPGGTERGPGGAERVAQRNGPSGPERDPRGPQPGNGPRQPWILVHADEIDLDKNKIISRDEIVGEATRAFSGYDADSNGKLSARELSSRGSRSAMGGFLKGHSQEIDRDGDGVLTRAEAIGNAERMFAKMDTDGDGEIPAEEMEASRRRSPSK